MEIIVKRYDELTRDELYEILRSRAEVFSVEQAIIYVDMDGMDKDSIHLFIMEEGRIQSYLRIIKPGVKYPNASIGRVLTLLPSRRKGYATMLMRKALDIALKLSLSVEIEAQAYLTDYYKRLGFIAVSDEFILEGIPHVSMIYPG